VAPIMPRPPNGLRDTAAAAEETGIGSNTMAPRLPISRFPARTLPALLALTARRVPERVFLRFIDPGAPGAPPRQVRFAGFRERVARAAAFLEAAGIGPGDRVVLLAENSPEWQAVALGAQLLRAEPAAAFASLGAAPTEEIARRVRPRAAFVSTAAQWAKLAPAATDLVRDGLGCVPCAEPPCAGPRHHPGRGRPG
jgi:long-chain acyl-CoA synthetase